MAVIYSRVPLTRRCAAGKSLRVPSASHMAAQQEIINIPHTGQSVAINHKCIFFFFVFASAMRYPCQNRSTILESLAARQAIYFLVIEYVITVCVMLYVMLIQTSTTERAALRWFFIPAEIEKVVHIGSSAHRQ